MADVVPPQATGAAMTGAIGSGDGRVRLPRPAGAPPELTAALRALGWDVVEAATYETRPVGGELRAEIVEEHSYDLIAFASPSAVDAFVGRFGIPDRPVACIGTTTADAAARRGIKVDVVPKVHGADALAAAIVEHLRK